MCYLYSSVSLLFCCWVLFCSVLLSNSKFFGFDSSQYSDPDTEEREYNLRQERLKKIRDNFVPLLFQNRTPQQFCEVTFHVRKRHVTNGRHYYKNYTMANFGNKLMIPDTFNCPSVDWERGAGKYYTLLMLDADAPSIRNTKYRCWLHWLVINIPYFDVRINTTQVMVEYVGPWPLKLTGKHRYVVLVYGHQNKIDYKEPYLNVTDFVERRNFSTYKFQEKYNLDIPVAINYFIVKAHRLAYQHYTNFPMIHLP